MATQWKALREYPAEMLEELAKTLEGKYPDLVIRGEVDVQSPFAMGFKAGQASVVRDIAQTLRAKERA